MIKIQEQFQLKLTDQEGPSRREKIKVYGVPEGTEGASGSMISFVEQLLRENLDIPGTKDL